MSLIPTSIKIAAEIESINAQTISFLRSMASKAYALANTEGEQQAILDVLGDKAGEAVSVYGTLYAALNALGKADGLTAPDPAVFVIAQDGTATYVAPQEAPEE